MEWLSSLKIAIDYMETHLLEHISADEVAGAVHISPFYFQRGFKIVTEYTIGEYLRNRRLYMAGLDVIKGDEKIIELSYKYGYDTPESFTKAFSRFHGLSPMQLRAQPFMIRVFLPITIEISMKGGNKMDYAIERMESMRVIGFERLFSFGRGYQEIPIFWNEFCEKCTPPMHSEKKPQKEVERLIADCAIGEFGICIDEEARDCPGKFRYMIAGTIKDNTFMKKESGDTIPEGMKVLEIPAYEWAKFKCVGSMPEAIQTVNTRIFKEWLPGNSDYEIAADIIIEWYPEGDTTSENYESAIWIPIKRK